MSHGPSLPKGPHRGVIPLRPARGDAASTQPLARAELSRDDDARGVVLALRGAAHDDGRPNALNLHFHSLKNMRSFGHLLLAAAADEDPGDLDAHVLLSWEAS